MKRFLLVLALMLVYVTPQAKVVCEEFVTEYGIVGHKNCHNVKGEVEPYYGPTVQEGDISRIEKNLDGSISVYRYGSGSNSEDYREVTKGEWKRIH